MRYGVSPALRTVYTIGRDPTACADLCSAVDQEAALKLELRSPDGALIATEEIGIIDTHYLLSLAECGLREDDTIDADQDWEIEALEGWRAGRNRWRSNCPQRRNQIFRVTRFRFTLSIAIRCPDRRVNSLFS